MEEAANVERKIAGISPLVLWAALIALGASFFLLWNRLTYSPDSWTLYELSRTVLPGHFYEVRHIRSFEQAGVYSSAFPPLWPTLIALADGATGLGARSGFVLAVLSSLLFAFASEQYGRRSFGFRWIGLTAAALVFVMPGFRDEVLAGRTIPLQLALYATVLGLAAQGPLRARQGLLIGGAIGLATLNRFDTLAVALLLPLAALLLRPKPAFFATYLAAFLLTISPWMIYSRARFGTLFKSDNSSIALAVEPRHIAEWYPHASANAFEAPLAWIGKVASNGLAMIGHFVVSPGLVTCLGLLIVVVIIRQSGQRPGGSSAETTERPPLRLLLFGPLLMSLTLSGYIVTGYFDERYFVPLWWTVMIAALALVLTGLPERERERAVAPAALAALVFALIFAVALPTRALPVRQDFPSREGDAELVQCLGPYRGELLMLGDPTEAARLTAVYGFRTIMMPRNIDRLSPADLAIFLKRYRVRIFALADGAALPRPIPRPSVAPLPDCPSGWFQQMVNQSVVHRPDEQPRALR